MIFIEYYYANFFDKCLTFLADHSIVTLNTRLESELQKIFIRLSEKLKYPG